MVIRKFLPGSEWLYLKIYSGTIKIDDILCYSFQGIIQILLDKKFISDFFFVRYYDPEFHLRIRIKLNNLENLAYVLNLFHKSINEFVENNSVIKLQIDTYERELERYGEKQIELVEHIFSIDSIAQIGVLKCLYDMNEGNGDLRWIIALILIDDILSALSISVNEKLNIISSLAVSFKIENGFDRTLYSKQINEKYRKYKNTILATMERRNLEIDECIKRLLDIRYERMCQLWRKYDRTSVIDVLPSIIHMALNRLFRTRNRVCEMMIYEFLSKYYKSYIARL